MQGIGLCHQLPLALCFVERFQFRQPGALNLTRSPDLRVPLSTLPFPIYAYGSPASPPLCACCLFVCINSGFPSGSQNHIGKALIRAGRQEQGAKTALTQQLLLPPAWPRPPLPPPPSIPPPPPVSQLSPSCSVPILQGSPGLAWEPGSALQGFCPMKRFKRKPVF